jgi:hypothetical protein
LRKVKDLLGKRFGRLLVIEYAGSVKNAATWKCLCDCGNITIVYRGNLESGGTLSCGCLNKENASKRLLSDDSPFKNPELIKKNALLRKGSHPSVETRQKMSDAHKGEKHPFYGKHHTEESKKKMSDSLRGRILTEETKNKIAISCKGINMGEKNGMYGMTGEKNHYYGKKHTIEELQKMSENRKGKCVGIENCRFGKPPAKGTGCGKGSYVIRSSDNKSIYVRSTYESRFVNELEKRNILWEYERRFDLGGTTYLPDFYLPKYDLYIEVKGYLSEISYIKLLKFINLYNYISLKVFELHDIELLESGESIENCGTELLEYLKERDLNGY